MSLSSSAVPVCPAVRSEMREWNGDCKTIKAVFTDLDGTFFDENHQLRKDVRETYLDARRAGVPVIPATGRMYQTVKRMMDHGHAEFSKVFRLTPGVYSHGCIALGKSDDDVLYANQMSTDAVWRVLRAIYDYKDKIYLPRREKLKDQDAFFIASIYTVDKAFSDFQTPEIDRFCESYEEWHDVFLARRFEKADFDNENGSIQRVVGVSVTSVEADLVDLAEYVNADQDLMKDLGSMNTRVLLPIPEQLHFLPADANKAKSIQILAKIMGVEAEDILTLGDSSNDVEMLEWAGTGVAMGNAREEVKKVADHVTLKGSEGGWASAVRRFLRLPTA